jgi:hypothetical protein
MFSVAMVDLKQVSYNIYGMVGFLFLCLRTKANTDDIRVSGHVGKDINGTERSGPRWDKCL